MSVYQDIAVPGPVCSREPYISSWLGREERPTDCHKVYGVLPWRTIRPPRGTSVLYFGNLEVTAAMEETRDGCGGLCDTPGACRDLGGKVRGWTKRFRGDHEGGGKSHGG